MKPESDSLKYPSKCDKFLERLTKEKERSHKYQYQERNRLSVHTLQGVKRIIKEQQYYGATLYR